MRFIISLPAVGIATVLALGALTVVPASATATDPSPTPSPTPSASPSPSPTPSAGPSPTADPSPAPTAEPSASTEPAPSTSPSPEPTPSPDPSPDPETTAITTTTTAPAATQTRTERIRERYRRAARIAVRQRHDRYVSGAIGPNAFDCSGLVRYAYRQAGISSRLGGGHSARAMLAWARRHDRTRRRNPHIGDVVIWGNGRHAGIYLGRGRVISALNPRQDIRITGLHALGDPFTAFISTRP